MRNQSKLKPTQRWLVFLTLIVLGVVIAAGVLYGSTGFYWAFGSIQFLLALFHFVAMWKTRNPVYVGPVIFYFLVGLTFLPPLADHPWHLIFAVAAAIALIGMFGALFSRQINWRYRDILELAARPVQDTSNGFTPRPFPSGQADYTREEVLGLARYLLKYVIAYPFIEKDRVVFVIPRYMWSYLLFFRHRYHKDTYIVFSDTGEVTVRMDLRDYQAFKDELTFDQLCASLGNLFKQFLREYKDGQCKKIVHRLDAVQKEISR